MQILIVPPSIPPSVSMWLFASGAPPPRSQRWICSCKTDILRARERALWCTRQEQKAERNFRCVCEARYNSKVATAAAVPKRLGVVVGWDLSLCISLSPKLHPGHFNPPTGRQSCCWQGWQTDTRINFLDAFFSVVLGGATEVGMVKSVLQYELNEQIFRKTRLPLSRKPSCRHLCSSYTLQQFSRETQLGKERERERRGVKMSFSAIFYLFAQRKFVWPRRIFGADLKISRLR